MKPFKEGNVALTLDLDLLSEQHQVAKGILSLFQYNAGEMILFYLCYYYISI